jgi:iron complex outermembrane recepter protein
MTRLYTSFTKSLIFSTLLGLTNLIAHAQQDFQTTFQPAASVITTPADETAEETGPVGIIKGTVKTSEGQPAPYVNLYIKELPHKGTNTDEDGNFTIKNVKEGSYTLVTSFVGFQSVEKSVEVKAGQVTFVEFQLSESAEQLAEVVVTDSRTLNERPGSIGKISIKPMDLPQSLITVDRSVLDRQQSLRVSDVLMNTSGVYVMGTTGGAQEELAGRGFSFGSTNTFKNGVRYNNGIMPEISSVEKVEVLKGSSAILFGNVTAGGVINFVSKKPKFENGGEFSFRTGSYDFYKPTLDIYGAVNGSSKVAYRFNTSYENALSYRDDVSSERIYFNPSFLIRATNNTDIVIEGDYLKDNRTLDFGIGAINYEIADIPRSRFIGAPWSYWKGDQKSATLTVNHKLSSVWKLQFVASYQGFYNDQFSTTRPNNSTNMQTSTQGMVRTDGTWIRGLQRSGTDQDYSLVQLDATANFKTGSLEHALLIGADLDQYDNKSTSYIYRNPARGNKNVYDSINIFNPELYPQRNDIPNIDVNQMTYNPIDRVGVYVQDHLTITEKIKVLAGLRYSYIESTSTPYTYKPNEAPTKGKVASYYDQAFSPRVGVVFQPTKATSIFASYANSFALNTGVDSLGSALPPSLIDQFEVGIKNDILKGLLSVNVTAYQIINNNFAQPYIITPKGISNAQELAGQVTSKGLEVDIMSRPIAGFSFIAGYSYNDTRYTRSTQYIDNSRLRYNPSHTANASAYYTVGNGVLKGLNVGLLGFYMGERVAGRSTQITTPNDTRKLMPVAPYFQIDASAGYTLDKVSLRVKVSNLLNELSYHVHDDNSVNPIAPRMFTATIGYKW